MISIVVFQNSKVLFLKELLQLWSLCDEAPYRKTFIIYWHFANRN